MSREKQNHVKKNKRQIIIYLLFAFVSISAQGSPDFVLKGDARPAARDTLQVSPVNDMSQYTFKWTRGDALGTFEGAALSNIESYVITEDDYEHWLRVSVYDTAGNTVYSKDTWISKLPVLYIATENGQPITSRENYVTANLLIQGNASFDQQYAGVTEIRGRGTTSWLYPQKPYKLKLNKKTNLFGFGKSKHWVLIPNFNDKSCLRNYIAGKLAKRLGVLAMEMTWVDVVLNGEVKGCYMLSQHIRADKNSVDIFDWEKEAEAIASPLFSSIRDEEELGDEDLESLEETMKQNLSWVTDGIVPFKGKAYNLSDYDLKKEYDTTKGYLFEATGKKDGNTQFATPQKVHFEVSTPEYLSTNSEMFSYVKEFWEDFEAEYCQVADPCKNFSKYADMKSMVGIWLVNEIMGQGDPTNSRYSYIPDDGKLHFGPAWDFDHGGSSWSADQGYATFFTLVHKLDFTYYRKWFPDPVLCTMAYDAYWDVARPFIIDYISEGGEMDDMYAVFAEAGKTNDTLWGSYPCIISPSAAPRTTAEDVEALRKFLLNHIKWLDKRFLSPEKLIEAMNAYCPYPCDPNTVGINETKPNTQTSVQKVLRDKHIYIIRNGETYSIDGKRME